MCRIALSLLPNHSGAVHLHRVTRARAGGYGSPARAAARRLIGRSDTATAYAGRCRYTTPTPLTSQDRSSRGRLGTPWAAPPPSPSVSERDRQRSSSGSRRRVGRASRWDTQEGRCSAEQFGQVAHRGQVASVVGVGVDALRVDGGVAEDFHAGLFVDAGGAQQCGGGVAGDVH